MYVGGGTWNIPLKPAAVPMAMAASACITDMAMARTVGIKSREKSMVNFVGCCLVDWFVGVGMNDDAFYNMQFQRRVEASLYFIILSIFYSCL
jgi:hypothetical protein